MKLPYKVKLILKKIMIQNYWQNHLKACLAFYNEGSQYKGD
jgi:hypothetical protein